MRTPMFAIAGAIVVAMSPAAAADPQLTFCGVHQAKVAGGEDPEGRGRISIIAPVTGDGMAIWAERMRAARNRAPGPAKAGDAVWIMFEGCDPERPVVLGFAAGIN